MQSSAHGARKQFKDQWVAISWLVFVARVFVICAQSLGNPIIKIISSAIFTRKSLMKLRIDRKKSWKE